MAPRLLRPLLGGLFAAGAYLIGSDYVARRERAESIQAAFIRFHDRIKHEQFGERDLLRERREASQAKLTLEGNPEQRLRLFRNSPANTVVDDRGRTGQISVT